VPAARALQTKLIVPPTDVKKLASAPGTPGFVDDILKRVPGNPHTNITFTNDALLWLALGAYAVILVALIGQTFGMMVLDLRVIRANHDPRIGFMRAIGRYVSLVASLFAIVGLLSFFRRIQPYEKWSRTRLVSGNPAIR